jgi:type III secretory pathway component EscV
MSDMSKNVDWLLRDYIETVSATPYENLTTEEVAKFIKELHQFLTEQAQETHLGGPPNALWGYLRYPPT